MASTDCEVRAVYVMHPAVELRTLVKPLLRLALSILEFACRMGVRYRINGGKWQRIPLHCKVTFGWNNETD